MKRFITLLLVLSVALSVFTLSVSAERPDPVAERLQEAVDLLDRFYSFNYDYMIRIASDDYVSWEEYGPKEVAAADFEATLLKYFDLNDSDIADIRTYGNISLDPGYYDEENEEWISLPFYDSARNVYTLVYTGGFGGGFPAREYLGYKINGEKYDVYYRTLQYEFLSDVYDGEKDYWDFIEELEYPESIEYKGATYISDMGEYCRIAAKLSGGMVYSVEFKGDVARILSAKEYTEADLPESFDDTPLADIVYDIPEGSGVVIPENDCFQDNTVVKVEEVKTGEIHETAKESMKEVSEKFVVFEFTATKDNAAVQPSGRIEVTFDIPDGYSESIAVYYMSKSGALTKLESAVNAGERSVTVYLEHFSTYIIADEEAAPAPAPTTPVVTTPDKTTPDATTPDETTPVVTTPDETTPDKTTPDATVPEDSDGEESADYTVLIVAVVLLLCAIVGFAGYMLYIKKKK